MQPLRSPCVKIIEDLSLFLILPNTYTYVLDDYLYSIDAHTVCTLLQELHTMSNILQLCDPSELLVVY